MNISEPIDTEWLALKEKYNILKTDLVRVPNIYRHICILYVFKADFPLWVQKQDDIHHYDLYHNNNLETNIYQKPKVPENIIIHFSLSRQWTSYIG